MEDAGISDLELFPIKVAQLARNQFGLAEKGTIFLGTLVFEHGKREVVKTLLEEYVHCKTQASDNTRFMQEQLINMVISAYEEKLGVYL